MKAVRITSGSTGRRDVAIPIRVEHLLTETDLSNLLASTEKNWILDRIRAELTSFGEQAAEFWTDYAIGRSEEIESWATDQVRAAFGPLLDKAAEGWSA